MKKKINRYYLILVCLCWFCVSGQAQPNKPLTINENVPDASVATAWAELNVLLMTGTRYNTPTYGSRALGYIGLTMYETVVASSSKYRSVATKRCDTLRLPKAPKIFCPELALNAGQAYMLNAFFGFANKQKLIDSLEKKVYQQYAARFSPAVATASAEYGKKIAARIYEWSKTDGGHDGWDHNFPKDYIRPEGLGLWIPPIVGQSNSKIPMHPTWGQNRTFSKKNAKLSIPKPLTYSEDSASDYYKQYKEVFEYKKTLTDTTRAIVMWWGDDPTVTCSPPGHSYHLATIAIRNGGADLLKATETYARVGMAVADAFVCCWKTKFTYMVERPSSFINRKIYRYKQTQGPWLPFFLEPPFPAFYSGHAVQSAAAATVLTELYGESFGFIDDTHINRPPTSYNLPKLPPDNFDSKTYNYNNLDHTPHKVVYLPRAYQSFWGAAQECANSRLMGGIHTRYDNEIGLQEGIKIGNNINALRWH
jgi:hypothetical protein